MISSKGYDLQWTGGLGGGRSRGGETPNHSLECSHLQSSKQTHTHALRLSFFTLRAQRTLGYRGKRWQRAVRLHRGGRRRTGEKSPRLPPEKYGTGTSADVGVLAGGKGGVVGLMRSV